MKTKQLSIFLENKSGRLTEVTEVLGAAGINLSAMSIADNSDFGILRCIVSDPDKAKAVLKEAGCLARITDVLAVSMEQKAGSLNRLTKIMTENKINIEYMYTLNSSREAGSMIIKCSDIEIGYDAVKKAGLTLVDPETAYAM